MRKEKQLGKKRYLSQSQLLETGLMRQRGGGRASYGSSGGVLIPECKAGPGHEAGAFQRASLIGVAALMP